VSIIPKALAEVLNLDLPEETDISYGIGGEIKVKNTKMKVILNKNHEKYDLIIPV